MLIPSTVRVTGMATGMLDTPGNETAMEPEYVPAATPTEFAETVKTLFPAAPTDSQLPPWVNRCSCRRPARDHFTRGANDFPGPRRKRGRVGYRGTPLKPSAAICSIPCHPKFFDPFRQAFSPALLSLHRGHGSLRYPADRDNGCPADQPPPATIVTEKGDVPLAGSWPRW